MSGWGHALRQLGYGDNVLAWQTCSWPGCRETPTHEGTFRSVTGRAGRVNTRRKLLCPTHAERFREKHGLLASTPFVAASRPAADTATKDES